MAKEILSTDIQERMERMAQQLQELAGDAASIGMNLDLTTTLNDQKSSLILSHRWRWAQVVITEARF